MSTRRETSTTTSTPDRADVPAPASSGKTLGIVLTLIGAAILIYVGISTLTGGGFSLPLNVLGLALAIVGRVVSRR